MDETQEILEEFIQESREHLSAIEPDLLEMERQGEQVKSEIVNRVFRAIHSTKGGASFLSFESLKNFSHAMESVLMLIRDGELASTSAVVDVLLRGVDILRAMIEDVENSDQVPFAKELAELEAILGGGGGQAEPSPALVNTEVAAPAATASSVVRDAPVPTPQATHAAVIVEGFRVEESEVSGALAQGMHLYRLVFSTEHPAADLSTRLNAIGRCLALVPEAGHMVREALCATVLDEPMLADELGDATTSIVPLDVEGLRSRLRGERGDSFQHPQPPVAAAEAPAPVAAAAPPPAVAAAAPAPETTTPPLPLETTPATGAEAGVQERVSAPSPNRRDGAADTLRVRVDLLNRLMNSAGELVLGRNQLLRSLKETSEKTPGLAVILQHIDRVTSELQEGIMQTRMQPVGTLFGRYPRVLRDLSRSLGKQINLHTEGEEVELDKSIIEALADPLTHIVRNCADHAIEMPSERQKAGKSPMGQVSLIAFHESGQVNIVVSDDGRGISRTKVIRKALDKGLITQTEAAHIAPHEVVKLVLMPGFSTAAEVSDISGRGVGMDVVRTNVEKLGGSVELETEEGMGTTVTLRLPLTLAIIPSLIVGASDARFAVPQVGIDELVWVRADDVQSKIETIQKVPVLRLRGRLLPLVRLSDVLEIEREFVDPGTGEAQSDRRQSIADQRVADGESRKVEVTNRRQSASGDFNILVLRAGGNRFGLVVDELFESEEIVLKPLPSYVKQISCFAGTTILGDGRVTMILDPGGLATLAKLSFVSVAREETRRQAEAERAESGTSERSVILFDSAPGEVFAVPQDRVLRLERIERKQVEVLGGQEFVKYRGAGLPVIRLDAHFPVTPVPSDSEEMFLIIPKDVQASQPTAARAGILAHRIVDARDVSVELHRPLFEGPGMKGSAIVDGNLTMFLDPVELVREMGYAEPGGV